ncbi:MAG: YcfL family protein [Proteobacteria bacterium]|nr:YcfL family protein [Pseudomonadota bacterium]
MRSWFKQLRYLSALGFILLLVSCSFMGKKNACPNGDVVFVGDVSDIDIVKVSCVPKDGILRVLVEIKNEDDKERSLSYRFDWFDEEGLILGKEEAWKPVYLYAKEVKIIRGTAPNWLATDTKFLIKE